MIRKNRIKKIFILYLGTFFIICGTIICEFIFLPMPGICKETTMITGYEKMSVRDFAEHNKIDTEKIINILKMNGIRVKDANQPINSIAVKNQVLPNVIYEIMMSLNNAGSDSPSTSVSTSGSDSRASDKKKNKKDGLGRGYGQKTIKDVCRDLNIPIKKAEKRLKAKGIVGDNTTELRDIAAKYKLRPRDIVDIIKTKKKGFFGF